MPTYEYVCKACHHPFERFQSITAPSVRTCPKCGRKRVERKIGLGGAVIFKGGGFYETDYRSESYRKGEDAERKSDSKSDSKGEGTSDGTSDGKSASDSKSNTKPESKSKNPSAESPARDEKKTTNDASKSSSASKSTTDSQTNSSGSTVDSTHSARASSRDDSKDTNSNPKGKSNARQGRGVGNVLQLGRIAKKSGPKTPARKRAR